MFFQYISHIHTRILLTQLDWPFLPSQFCKICEFIMKVFLVCVCVWGVCVCVTPGFDSYFCLISYFWKFVIFCPKKKVEAWPKMIFSSFFFGQNFQQWEIIQKSERTFPQYMRLDGLGIFFVCVCFVKKYIFTLVKNSQKISFWRFLKNAVFSQKNWLFE